jgi:dihydroorotase
LKYSFKSQKEGKVNVLPIGCYYKRFSGTELAEIGILKKAGIVAVSADGNPVASSQIMRERLNIRKCSICRNISL